jgi:hypothetical protein
MAEFFDEFPFLYSDIASLEPHIREKKQSYASFFKAFPGRVLLGSDSIAAIGLAQASRYSALIRELALPVWIEEAILSGNAARFLGWKREAVTKIGSAS